MVDQNRSLMRKIFFTNDDERLRASWRLLLYVLLVILISFPAGIIVLIPIGLLKIDFGSYLATLA